MLTDEQFASASEHFADSTVSPKLKKCEDIPYSVIRSEENHLYAIYSPDSPNKEKHKLGEGSYGNVKIAQNLATQEWCAIKVSKDVESLKNEQTLLNLTGQYFGFASSNNKHYLIMKFIPGLTLESFNQALIDHKISLSKRQQAVLVFNLLKSYNDLLQLGIEHGDLHPGNIMVNPEYLQLTIIDFGWATLASKSRITDESWFLCRYASISSKILNMVEKASLEIPTDALPTIQAYINKLNIPPSTAHYARERVESSSSFEDFCFTPTYILEGPSICSSSSSSSTSSSFASSPISCIDDSSLFQRKRVEQPACDRVQDENKLLQNTKRQRS